MSAVAFGPQEALINTGKSEMCINIEKAMLSYTHVFSGSKPCENSHPQRFSTPELDSLFNKEFKIINSKMVETSMDNLFS